MLLKREIEDIAKLNRLKPYQQEKHYLQTIILNSIYSEITNELVFKGGTALFFAYGINRFSEDLDFTLINKIDISKLIDRISKNFELLGIRNKIYKLKENSISISFKIAAEGPLFTKEIEKCFVDIEISKREKVENFKISEIKTVYPDIPPFAIVVMSEEEILAEKIRAIMARNQARDVYDLWFLLKNGIKLDIGLINRKLSYYKQEFNKYEFFNKIKEKQDIWNIELKPFIIGNLPEFKSVIKEIQGKMIF